MVETQESELHNSCDIEADQPRFEAAIFYNFAFDLGGVINPTIAARSLLKADFAIASANNLNEDIEVAERFRHLLNIRSQIKDISEVIQNKDSSSLTKWILRHPSQFLHILYAMLSKRLFHEKPSNATKERSKEDFEDTIRFIDEAMINIQLLAAIHRDVDKSLFTPGYFQENPFARINLQPFFTVLMGERIGIDVEVLIHRTGVAILTFFIIFNKQKSADELVELRYSSSICSLEICKSVIECNPELFAEPCEQKSSSGVDWCIYKKLDDYRLMDIFELYQWAIISAIHKDKPSRGKPWYWQRSPTTLAYPILFIDRIVPAFLDVTEFKKHCPEDLTALALRIPRSRKLKEKVIKKILNEDLSLDNHHSLYISSGHAICIYYEQLRQDLIRAVGEKIPGQDLLSRHLNTSIIIDTILIQRWILTIQNDQLSDLPSNFKKLNDLKREILLCLEEFNNVTLTHGETQDIIRQAREKTGINEMHRNLMQKLNDIDKLIEAEETDRRAKRDILVKFAALFATVIFGLVGSWQMIGVITEWSPLIPNTPRGWMQTTLAALVTLALMHKIALTLVIYFTFVAIFIALFAWSFFPSSNKNKLFIEIRASQQKI